MKYQHFCAAKAAASIILLCIAGLAQTAVPPSLNYQGYLTDPAGSSLNGNVQVVFSIYAVGTGGVALWTDTTTVAVDHGLFSVQLGAAGSFPPGLFDTALWLGVTVAGDAEMVPRRPLTTVGFAFKADDALSLQGQGPAAFDQSGHVMDPGNPHGVTAAQSGAATPADIVNLQLQVDVALATINQLQIQLATTQADLAAEVTTRMTADDAQMAARIAADDAEAAARLLADTTHGTAIAAIEANSVLALDGVLTRPDAQTALFTAVNVKVVNGAAATHVVNGLGNLIVGYDAIDNFDSPICSLGEYDNQTACETNSGVWAVSHKSGSHNVVIGSHHNYSRYAGLVVGQDNNITGPAASVIAGQDNTASGFGASVSAGDYNTASGDGASVSGGRLNTASENTASVSGGSWNTASFENASVGGGYQNSATGSWSSVSGGHNNTASGDYASISGGVSNIASDVWASVSGGASNDASGEASSISGGWDNAASGDYASVSGGRNNTASGFGSGVSGGGGLDAANGNEAFADYSSILGGRDNFTGDGVTRTAGDGATVSGGQGNTASGNRSSVSGGLDNMASFNQTSVSGGNGNTASGNRSSVSGGLNRLATSDNDWRAGSLFEDF